MASSNRTAQINHILKVLKKHFKPAKATAERSVLEHLLFACCLENSLNEDAEAAFSALRGQFFDWNEVRVSTVRELAEAMKGLVDPEGSAIRLKRTLQSVFESIYAFELEPLTKENLGKATERLAKYPGTTPFVVAHVTQAALGGHAIAVNPGMLLAFHVLGVVSDEELGQGVVPGLERAIPKTKGPEVASILHQFGVLVGRNPCGATVRKILLEIDPECKDRLPRRAAKDPAPQKEEEKPPAGKVEVKSKTDALTKADSAEKPVKKAPKKVVKPKTADRRKAEADAAASKKKVKTSAPKKTVKKTKTGNRQLAKSKPR